MHRLIRSAARLNRQIWLSIALLVLGCGSPEPIRIGFLGGISGRVADLGTFGRDGAQLAVDLRNQAVGVDGRRVVLLVGDDRQDPDKARQELNILLDQRVAAIVGPMTSDMALAIVPLLNTAQVVAVSPTVTTEVLSGLDDQFIRVCSTTKVFAAANANYQIKSHRMRRVAAALDLGNHSFSENWLEHFAKHMEQGGGEVIAKIEFKSDTNTSFSGIAEELLAAKPDGVVIVANSVDSAMICQHLRKLDSKIPITISDWGASERLVELGGKAVEGVTLVQTFSRDSDAPGYQKFRALYQERFGREPGFAGVYSFEATNLVLDALLRDAKPANLKQTILSVRSHEGLQGPFTLDNFGDAQRGQYSMSLINDGRFVVIE